MEPLCNQPDNAATSFPRIGDLLVRHGVLTHEQVQTILGAQQRAGRPFGDLAERMFGVDPHEVESAWIEQYAQCGTRVDLTGECFDKDVLDVLTRRQAWQFGLLPLRRDPDGTLVMATSEPRLTKAVRFVWRRLHEPVHLLMVEENPLRRRLTHCYPWPAMMSQSVVRWRLNHKEDDSEVGDGPPSQTADDSVTNTADASR